MEESTIHPRLEARREPLARLLNLDDRTEASAALQELQTLLVRCGYHIAFALHERALYLSRRRRSRDVDRTTGTGRRGRPPGSSNWASQQLGLGLATIWFAYTGRPPTRRVDGYGDGQEYGPYRDFVEGVMAVVPRRLRATRKGCIPQVDHLVRIGVNEFNASQVSPMESLRRGLLDERRWNQRGG